VVKTLKSFDPSAGSFTEWLRDRTGALWQQATEHPFTKTLADDTLEDSVYRRYLIQDYVFIESLVTVLGYAVALAPDMAAKKRFSGFLAAITSEENDYFLRSFEALGVGEEERNSTPMLPQIQAFADLMLDAARSGAYEEVLAVIVPAEWVYLSWAKAAKHPYPKRFYLAEWIQLHDNPIFEEIVNWLRSELDRVGPSISIQQQGKVLERFSRLVELEVAFFDAAYG
jgi:thiaminase/transcriptional activator TenA